MNEGALRLGAFAGVLALMALAEAVAPRRSFARARAARWPANLALVAISSAVLRLVAPIGLTGVVIAVQGFGWGLLPRLALPPWLDAVAAFLALDFVIYLQHRVFHASPLLWRLHQVHHCDVDMDATTGVRFHPLEMLASFGLKALAIAALGAPAGTVLVFEVWLNAVSLFNHANWRMPATLDAVVRWVLVTPDMHRVHHSVHRQEQDSNFGFNLPWWDRLFGTYRALPADGHTAMRLGLNDDAGSRTLLALLHMPFDAAGRAALSLAAALLLFPGAASAQEPDPHAAHRAAGAQEPAAPHHVHEEGHVMLGPGGLPMSRLGSGTSWIPDDSLLRAVSPRAGAWMVMVMGQAFGQVLHEGGYFGETQGGSINWVMGMGQRRVGKGWLLLSGMASAEPWTIPGCGYPNMLATGELCDRKPIHEKQHPHDAVMELAASYTWPVTPTLNLQVYGGPAGEPALGPAAFPHRGSSTVNPLAPIAHHWLDATHITYGVATAGLFTRTWKVEGSVFNGREPDENRHDLDLARLDSYSGRVWWMPSPRWAIQLSAGHLNDAEPPHDTPEPADKNLVTASASYSRRLAAPESIWASTVAWGRADETGSVPTQFLLMETSLARDAHDTWFGRAEVGTKSPHDLSMHGITASQGLGKLQGGYVRHLDPWRGWQPGVGFTVSAAMTNALIGPRYGSRVTWGSGLFVTLRPAAMR